jgi:hypothetical protein
MARPDSCSQYRCLILHGRGIAAVLGIAALGVVSLSSSASADERLDSVLQLWVAGAADIEPPSLATARARFGLTLSVHQLEAAVFLWAPDSVDSLTTKFDWTIETTNRDEVVLTGVPDDEVDRAFIGTVEVRWDADTQRPTSIAFEGVDESIRFATIRRARDPAVDHVVFYQEAAESGAEAIVDRRTEVRTASAVIGESVTSIDLPSQSAGVDEILDRWAAASATDGPWQIDGECYDYDDTFHTEKRFTLMMRGDGVDTVEIWKTPVDVPSGIVNEQKRSADGSPYEVVAGDALAMVFTPDVTISADPVAQTLYRVDNSVFDGFPWYKHPLAHTDCMTLNLSVDADELRDRFLWEIADRRDDEIWLKATPRTEEVARCVMSVQIILDAGSFLPKAIQCTQESREAVMVVHERAERPGLSAVIILDGYTNYSQRIVPQKGERESVPAAGDNAEEGSTLWECSKWIGVLLLCL